MKKMSLLVLMAVLFVGCTTSTVTVHDVVLLPEDRIYTVPAGQMIAVTLDNKRLEMVFPTDMKLVHSSILVRQEENLNDAVLRKAKAEKTTARRTGILGSIIALITTALGVILKMKKSEKKK